jgi:hypothetical protein
MACHAGVIPASNAAATQTSIVKSATCRFIGMSNML